MLSKSGASENDAVRTEQNPTHRFVIPNRSVKTGDEPASPALYLLPHSTVNPARDFQRRRYSSRTLPELAHDCTTVLGPRGKSDRGIQARGIDNVSTPPRRRVDAQGRHPLGTVRARRQRDELDGRSRPPGYCRLSTARRFRTGSSCDICPCADTCNRAIITEAVTVRRVRYSSPFSTRFQIFGTLSSLKSGFCRN